MKKLLTLLFILVFIFSLKIDAYEDMNIDKLILIKMVKIGICMENIISQDLEPDELISYDEFCKKDLSSQKDNPYVWSTIRHDSLDKLDIKMKSSSTLNGYPTTNLFDNKISTAWVPKVTGTKGNGIGEWIAIDLHIKKYRSFSFLTYFNIIPGYLKSDKTWKENNRIKSGLLVIERIGDTYHGNYTNYAILRLNFKDYKGIQIFKIEDYAEPGIYDKKMWFFIEDVYTGTKYNDTCISEIVIQGGIPDSADEP